MATVAHTIEVEDCVTARIRFESGAMGTLLATTAAAPGFPHRLEVYGTRGGVQIEGEEVVRWTESSPRGSHHTSRRRPALAPAPADRHQGRGPRPAGGDLVAAIRDGRPPSSRQGRPALARAGSGRLRVGTLRAPGAPVGAVLSTAPGSGCRHRSGNSRSGNSSSGSTLRESRSSTGFIQSRLS